MEVSFLFIHCMTNSFTFLNMQRFTFFYPQSYPQSKPPTPSTNEKFSWWIFRSWIISLSPAIFSLFIFPQTHYRIFKVVDQFHCLAINESTVPNANVYFDCFRTWGNMFGIGASLFFLHNLYVSYCIYYDIII